MPRPAALAAAALLLACGARRLTPDEYQRQLAHVLSPAPVRAPPAAVRPAEVKTLRLLAYADAEHRASAPDWEARILDLARRANELLEVQFGVRFEVAVRPWERNPRAGTLDEALGELERLDRAGADWVIGFVGPTAQAYGKDAVGAARRFRPFLVLRAMMSSAELAAIDAGFDTLREQDRLRFAEENRLHRETVVFLHEWAHTLGAVHECDLKWIMADEYAEMTSTFSPESERLVRVGLVHRAAATPAARLAWRDAWRAEAARMQSVSWECPKLERSLAETDAWLAKAFARDELELRAVPASAPAAPR